MAKKQGKVYLGYEDETVTEKTLTLLNHTTNKVGGAPDWPPLGCEIRHPKCHVCGLYRLLIVQCYAPLENSIYHRTLYVFACINPNCWTQPECWTCYRSQIQDKSSVSNTNSTVLMPTSNNSLAWCNGADDWDINDNDDQANGNFMSVDNGPISGTISRNSDEEDESNSIEVDSVEQAFGNLQMFDAHNANTSPVQGAVGGLAMPIPAAEFEGGDEPGLVTVDTPSMPNHDLQSLLNQTAELPVDIRSRLQSAPLQFTAKFVYVEEEAKQSNTHCDDRVTELLNKYRRENDSEPSVVADSSPGAGGGKDDEQYEEAAPLHGDRLFHAFVTRLKQNPGQILRYSREEPPILGAPLPASSPETPTTCSRCHSRLICELQLVPSLSDAIRLAPNNMELSHLHFLSVLVFTCSQSCWQTGDTIVKETIVFQPEI